MKRTTIMLPEDLKKMVENEAHRRGSSAGEVIRLALKELFQPKRRKRKKDPLFTDDLIYKGTVEKDYSLNHDNYLY